MCCPVIQLNEKTDMARYPENIKITLDDFKKCGWREALQEAQSEDYSSMRAALSKAAGESVTSGNLSEGKVLWLLSDACSMMLKPESLNEPFAPLMIMNGMRSALPEDFKDDEILFFSEIYSEIDEPRLCARISDILWLLVKPKDHKHALSAIDNYIKIEVTYDNLRKDGLECWDRAIRLCLILKNGAGERLKNINSAILESLKNSSPNEENFVYPLSQLLLKHSLKDSAIPEKLKGIGSYFKDTGKLHLAVNYFDAAAIWYKLFNNNRNQAEMFVYGAECCTELASKTSSNIAALGVYEDAIKRYRSIPKKLREQYNADEKITDLRKRMNDAGEHSFGEMRRIYSGSIDIDELINKSIKLVKGKNMFDVLHQFANIHRGANKDELRSSSEETIKNYPLQSLFSGNYMSEDGRVIAKSLGLNDGSNKEAFIWPKMVNNYLLQISLAVQGVIWPALETIRQEHRLKETDFYQIALKSPVVPPEREMLIAKAIYFGYDNDFVSSIHLLAPQVEHMVRYHLKQRDVTTTTLDSNGIENEHGLSTLIENKESEEIFGKDLHFELKVLFCDSFGPNLRNEIAHGLISYEGAQSIYSIYAWWLIFRIVFNTSWNNQYRNNEVNQDR